MSPDAPSIGRAEGAGDIRIMQVRSKADLRRFIRFAWQVYAGDPAWVPPLNMDMMSVLDGRKHPFHQHADVELFLAWRGDRLVGRIAAILNRAHIEFHEEKAGFFGLFETFDDAAVAGALLTHVEAWLRQRGMQVVRGPMNLSTNDELWSPGVLIDGFDKPPFVLMGHTPRYYAPLLEGAGYVKSKDLLAYWYGGDEAPERFVRVADKLMQRAGVRMRPLDMKQLQSDVAIVQDIYNSAWERNWGFVPMTGAEIRHLAAQLKPVVNPTLCPLAFVGDEAVGFALALLDFNVPVKHMNGRLLPFGIFKMLWYRRQIRHVRILTLGMKPQFRGRGIDMLLMLHIWRECAKLGINSGECSWILEDNLPMRHVLEHDGGYPYKTYRVFEKPLAPSD